MSGKIGRSVPATESWRAGGRGFHVPPRYDSVAGTERPILPEMSASTALKSLYLKKSLLCKYQLCRRMTTYVSIKNILATKPIGDKIRAKGWIQSCRSQKQNIFVDLKDGSCADRLQILINPQIFPEGVGYGCSVDIEGTLVVSNHAKQPVELIASKIHLLGPCNLQEYPFQAKERHTEDHERQFPHLRARVSRFASMLRIRSSIAAVLRKHFIDNGYFEVHMPIITSSDCEGAGEVFSVQPASKSIIDPTCDQSGKLTNEHFFNKEVYLTVSSQMHLETMACALSKVFTLGPTFRAEHSRTRHHLSEFYMLEAEIAFLDNLSELMTVIEKMVKCAVSHVIEHWQEIQKNHPTVQLAALEKLLKHPFIILPYTEAVGILQKSNVGVNIKWGMDLQKDQERYLVQHHDNIPVFVTNFPHAIKPFYMKLSSDDSRTVESLDLLVADVGEICGGSMRENRVEILEERMKACKLDETLEWYLDLRKYGSVSHGGFGLGFDRFIQYILGISNIRDIVAFPRWPHHCPM